MPRRQRFRNVPIACRGSWPDDVPSEPPIRPDLDGELFAMNTFDAAVINERIIVEALKRLRPGGCLVVGWNSDFSGRTVDGYSHWSIRMLEEMQKCYGLSAPLVAEARRLLAEFVPDSRSPFETAQRTVLSMIRRKAICPALAQIFSASFHRVTGQSLGSSAAAAWTGFRPPADAGIAGNVVERPGIRRGAFIQALLATSGWSCSSSRQRCGLPRSQRQSCKRSEALHLCQPQ